MYFDKRAGQPRDRVFRGSRTRQHGFSLIEIMVVLVIIGLLASVVTINVRGYLVKARQETARMEIATLKQAVDTFESLHGQFPTNAEGLDILTTTSDKMPEPLIDQVPVDPWGRPYQYSYPGQRGGYDIICYGADGTQGGDGANKDITNWDLQDR